MKTSIIAAALLALFAVSVGCDATPTPPVDNKPISPDVPPIRNCAIKLLINSNLTYTAKDEAGARGSLPDQVVARLNRDGIGDGNTFSIASGEAQNFTLTYTVNNDGNNRFTGSVYMAGWGQGYLNTFYSGEYTYSNGPDMIDAVTDKAYTYIHGGWHDARKDKK